MDHGDSPDLILWNNLLTLCECCSFQVRNLSAREGWRTEIASAIHGRGIASLSKGVLPLAEVTVTLGGETKVVTAKDHSVSPRFEKKAPLEFKNVAIGSRILIQVCIGPASVSLIPLTRDDFSLELFRLSRA